MKEKKENAKKGKVMKTTDIVTAYRLINPAKLTKMEVKERYALILITRQLKKVATEFDDLLKDAQEKLKPAGLDAIVGKVEEKKGLTPQERDVLKRYNKDVSDCVKPELDKEVELDIVPLGKEAMEHFFDSNDFSVGDVVTIMDVIGE